MKKIIWIVVIIVLVGFGFYLYNNSSPSQTNTTTPVVTTKTSSANQNTFVPVTQTDPELLGKLKSATVSVAEDGTSENLINGVATFSTAGSGKTTVSLYSSSSFDTVSAEKVFNGRKDVLAVVTLSASQKNSQYLILFEDTGASLNQKSIAYLGDSLDIKSIATMDLGASGGEDYVVTVSSNTSSGKSLTSILPVKNGVFDTANSLSL